MSVAVVVDAIPAELRDRPQWMPWRFEERDGKRTKVPYRADGGGRASSTDPATWSTFAEADAAVEWLGMSGFGFVFYDDPFCGVDLDAALPAEQRAAIIATLASYTETSVSGTGVHVIVRARLGDYPRNRKGPLEVYDRGRYFVVTGAHVRGTPTTIEDRQAELEQVLAEYLPLPSPAPTRPPQPVAMLDQELLERAFIAANGPEIERLYRGDTTGYPSQSEADQALCNHLAFWTACDPIRIDALFRSSGLYRPKWERTDYRERTIAKAIESTPEVYTPPSQVRPRRDAPGRDSQFRPEDEGERGRCVPRPSIEGRRDGRTYPTSPAVSDQNPSDRDAGDAQGDAPSSLEAEEASAFAAIDEASATPLLGDDANTVLAASGSAVYYGDGGAGKTTLGLDRAFHYCAGLDWLGIAVPHPLRVLWIENEGPRGKFRTKVRAKLEAWDEETHPLEGRLHVLVTPWARFTFAKEPMRAEFVELVRRLEIDVVIAGPIARLGLQGGGTPEEVQVFVDMLELVRAALDRPLAYELLHHENKRGDVSGAWEGATDTLVHVRARGNGRTAIFWQKARWANELQGKTWKLDWRDGERYERDETPETTDEEIAEKLVELVGAAPGQSWNSYDDLLAGKGKRKRQIRDELLADGELVNQGTAKAMRLFLPGQVAATLLDDDGGGTA